MWELISFLVLGALAGYLATTVMKKEGFGLWANLGIGVVGAFVGSWLLGWLINGSNFIGQLITAFIGAMILLWVVDYFKKKK